MNRVVQYNQMGDANVLSLEEVSIPNPGLGEVLVETSSSALNRADSKIREGIFYEIKNFPMGSGLESSGKIKALGEGVKDFKVGENICVLPLIDPTKYSLQGDFVLAPRHAVISCPDFISPEEASSIWMMYLTSWSGLVLKAQIKKGDFVLISAAASSVGIAAIQIANLIGAIPIALSRSSSKKEKLMTVGAKEFIATKEEDLLKRVQEITQGLGVQIVFDSVGGKPLVSLLEACGSKAKIVLYGTFQSEPTPIDVGTLLSKQLVLMGHDMSDLQNNPNELKSAIEFIKNGFKEKKLNAFIDKTFDCTEVKEAYKYFDSGKAFGKVILKFSKETKV